jgi:hypothetical protein
MSIRSVVVLSIILLFLFTGFFLSKYFQKIIQPRQSSKRLLIYLLSCLLLIFALSFVMVFIIARLFPDELIK